MQDQINTCEDEGHVKKQHLDDLRARAATAIMPIDGYVNYLRKKLREEPQ